MTIRAPHPCHWWPSHDRRASQDHTSPGLTW